MTPSAVADWRERWRRDRIIAVIRSSDRETALALAEAAIAGGLNQIEIAANTARFDDVLRTLRQSHPQKAFGSGTIVSPALAHRAIAAGAQFLFSPYANPAVADLARQHEIPYVPGALTPREIGLAWESGATAVKVFPIQSVGGPAYLRALQGPLGHIPLIPTGGVTAANAAEFLQAGALAVGLASDLFPPHLVASRAWDEIGARLTQVLRILEPSAA